MDGEHDEADVVDDGHRFTVTKDGETAELTYRRHGDRLVLVHAGVPDHLEGHGVGSALVRAAVRRARAEGLTVVPWCPFAQEWLRRHPEEAGGISIEWTGGTNHG